MSKRHGDIQVEDFIVSLSTSLFVPWDILTSHQKRGWQPDAVLNWLLLCGYGVRHETPSFGNTKFSSKQLESNKIMDLKEMIELVCHFFLNLTAC